MIDKLKDQLINNSDLGLTQFQIDYIVGELDKINVYLEVARNEVNTAIEDLYNDDVYNFKDKLDKLSDSDINSIAWKVYNDYDIWHDVYDIARGEVSEKAGLWEDD